MSRKAAVATLALAAPLLLAEPARPDEVYLRNGSTIVGRVTEDGPAGVVVSVRGGTVRLARREVDRIRRVPLPEDLYAERAARTELGDPDALRGLAEQASRLGLADQERKLRRMADELDLERRVMAVAPNDAAGFREAALFARRRGLGAAVTRYLYERALAADPRDEAARIAIEELDREERLRRALAERRRAEDEQRATERAQLERAARAAREDAERLRVELERERARLRAEERRLRALEAAHGARARPAE